jgi:hypothetical protein
MESLNFTYTIIIIIRASEALSALRNAASKESLQNAQQLLQQASTSESIVLSAGSSGSRLCAAAFRPPGLGSRHCPLQQACLDENERLELHGWLQSTGPVESDRSLECTNRLPHRLNFSDNESPAMTLSDLPRAIAG